MMTRAGLLAGCLLLVLAAVPAASAPRDNRPLRTPPRPAPAAPTTSPAAAPQTAIGLCQCIADRSKRNISCLSSADQCQSTCATTLWSFVPFAPSCPITAR